MAVGVEGWKQLPGRERQAGGSRENEMSGSRQVAGGPAERGREYGGSEATGRAGGHGRLQISS